MSAGPRTKRSRSHVGPDGAALRRKDDDIQLHDEADLVNFRADAFTRFIENQDQLENVTLKPFHTANIAPPSSFPVHSTKKYAPSATDAEVDETLAKLGPEELFMGDRRLMEAKMRQLARELAAAKEELAQQTPDAVFGTDFTQRSKTILKLARLQAACLCEETMAELEKAAQQLTSGENYVFGLDLHRQFSIPIDQLAPDVEVATAPPLYNPRLILSFIDIGNPADEFLMMDGLKELASVNLAAGEPQSAAYAANGNDDFVFGGAKAETAGANAGLDMDELNDLFVDPGANERMDEMDALMNFDQDTEGGLMNDDAFTDNFLS